jgi:hypothetical protein
MQQVVLVHILHPTVMKRMTDSRLYGNKYAVSEMVTDLTNGIFETDLNGNVNTFRQNLQINYVEMLASIVGEKSAHDNISKSAALSNLKRIQTQMRTALAKGDADTKAHREHIIFIIEQALDKN